MFKGYLIEYGYYLLVGVLAAYIQAVFNINFWAFWGCTLFGIAYIYSIPLIYRIAWSTHDKN